MFVYRIILLDNNTALQYNKEHKEMPATNKHLPVASTPTVATVKYVQPNYWVYPKNLVSHLLQQTAHFFSFWDLLLVNKA